MASLQPPASGSHAFARVHFLLGKDFLSLHYLCLTDSLFLNPRLKCSLLCEATSDFHHNLEGELVSPFLPCSPGGLFPLFTCLSVDGGGPGA